MNEIEKASQESALVRAINYLSSIEDSYTAESDRFVDYIWEHGISPESIKRYIAEIAESEVSGQNRKIAAETYNKHVKAVKNRIRALVNASFSHLTGGERYRIEETLKEIPLKSVQHYAKEDEEIPSPEEMRRLLAHAPKRLSLIMEFLLFSGARISEALNVRLGDLKKNKGHITVTLRGKGGKERKAYIPRNLYDRIVVEFDDHNRQYLFQHHGRKYSRNSVANMVKQHSLRIIGKDISPHDIRHRLGTDMTKEYGLWSASSYLGHSTIAITQKFYNANRVTAKHIKDLYKG